MIDTIWTTDGVILSNPEDATILWRDGFYGIKPENSIPGCFRFSWHEAVFLHDELSRIKVVKEGKSISGVRLYDVLDSSSVNFANEYKVYRFFRLKGWIVKSGLNYGTDFILYRNSPEEEHAQYAVMVLNYTDQLDFRKLLGVNRSCVGAKKRLLISLIEANDHVKIMEISRFLPEGERQE